MRAEACSQGHGHQRHKAIYFEGPGGQGVRNFRLNPANGSALAIWYRKADLTAGPQRRPGVHAAFAVDEFAAEDYPWPWPWRWRNA